MIRKVLLLSLILLCINSCSYKKETLLSGSTMGTTYHIKVITNFFYNTSALKEKIDTRLKQINKSMSVYDPDSEISKFNKISDSTTRLPISDDFFNVLAASEKLYKITDGAWDGTISPLINAWGFGSEEKKQNPDKQLVGSLLQNVGFDQIVIENKTIGKKNKNITLNLSSIAKGYGVDVVAKLVQKENICDFLVEIGGEVFASGQKRDGSPWKIGINKPSPNAAQEDIYTVVKLFNKAIATSGDYRKYFEQDNKIFSHVIDPKNGYPVSNGVASVSIIGNDCTKADGLATAIMIMGVKKGIKLIDSLEGFECMVIKRTKDHEFVNYYSKGFLADG